jgi:ankyrin repeat protein
MEGKVQAIEQLLRAGADIEARSAPPWKFIGGIDRSFDGSFTPLHFAAARGKTEALKTLLKANADANARDGWGCTPLYSACAAGALECVELLVDHGANLNLPGRTVGDDGTGPRTVATPLAVALQKGHSKIADLLIEHGAKKEADASSDDRPVWGARPTP